MASATWRSRLLKLNLALVATQKVFSRKSRPRRLRPRLVAEQLEDRTLPSGGAQLLEPAVHHPPTPPPQGPAAHGPPAHANNDNGQGQNNSAPAHGSAAHAPPAHANDGNDKGQVNSPDPQGPAAQGSSSPANNDQGNSNGPPPHGPAARGSPSFANNGNGKGPNNTPAPHGRAAEEPPSSVNDDNGQGQENPTNPEGPAAHSPPPPANNGQGKINSSTGSAASFPGNGNGRGEGEENSGEAENSQPTPVSGRGTGNRPPSSLESEGNGQGNDNGQGVDNGQAAASRTLVASAAQVSRGIGAMSAELTQESNAAGAAESSAAQAFAETLLADESIALGVIARAEGEIADASLASPGGSLSAPASEDDRVAVPDVGTASSGGGMPLLIASSPTAAGGAFAAVVTGLQTKSGKEEFKPLTSNTPITDLDRLFLQWWDDDQLLFPDEQPPIDEMLFPEAMPRLNDMILPNDMLLPNESSSGDDLSLNLGRFGLVPAPAPTAVRWQDALALSAPATGAAGRSVPISQPVSAKAGLESVSADPGSEEPAAGENIRPYHIALGMMPFLVAFGYTPSSLRDHVHVGQRVWKRLRGHLRRKS